MTNNSLAANQRPNISLIDRRLSAARPSLSTIITCRARIARWQDSYRLRSENRAGSIRFASLKGLSQPRSDRRSPIKPL